MYGVPKVNVEAAGFPLANLAGIPSIGNKLSPWSLWISPQRRPSIKNSILLSFRIAPTMSDWFDKVVEV